MIRDGVRQKVKIEQLVPGDLVILVSGDKIPADIRLLESRDLAVDESLLTGESLAVPKNANMDVAADAPLAQLLHIGALYLPGLSTVLELSPIRFGEWLVLAVIALCLLLIEEIHKYCLRRHAQRQP